MTLPTSADVDAIYAAWQDPDIQRYTTVPSPYARSDAEGFVSKVAEDWTAGQHLTWALREDGGLVGTIGVYRIDGKGSGELGYWVAPWARGRGVLLEAAREVVDWGFSPDGLDLARMEWRAVVGNVASARGARSLGFRYEGTLRQALVGANGQRDDGWIAGVLRSDDRMPQPWPVLDAA